MPFIKTTFRHAFTAGSLCIWAYVAVRSAQGLYLLGRDGVDLITGKDRHTPSEI